MARHQDAVYRQIARVCDNYDDAQDVLVETLLTAYRAIDQVRDPDSMRAWLATIGRRICRRMKQKESLSPIIALVDEGSYSYRFEDEMESHRMKECVQAALSGLPDGYRDVYVLRDLQGLPASEVAKQLGISVGSLKSRLHRARGKIRVSLDSGFCGQDSRE